MGYNVSPNDWAVCVISAERVDVFVSTVTRLIPGVIGQQESHEQDSFSEPHLLDHPHYTRPREFREMQVPEVLLSGNHGEIEAWRREAARDKTRRNRPDLG